MPDKANDSASIGYVRDPPPDPCLPLARAGDLAIYDLLGVAANLWIVGHYKERDYAWQEFVGRVRAAFAVEAGKL